MASSIEYMAEVVKSLTLQLCEVLATAEQLKTRSDFLQEELDKATKKHEGKRVK